MGTHESPTDLTGIPDRILEVVRESAKHFAPPPNMPPHEIGQTYIRLPPEMNAEGGLLNMGRTPWWIQVSPHVHGTRYNQFVFVTGSQVGKTVFLAVCAIWGLMVKRKPVKLWEPNKELARRISQNRFDPIIAAIPELAAGIDSSTATIHEKYINGIYLGTGWAGSETQLSSDAICVALGDELDRMSDIPGKGHPFGMMWARTSTFTASKKMLVFSTPLEGNVKTKMDPVTGLEHWVPSEPGDVSSPIWLEMEAGTRHEWAWPCMSATCKHYFIPRLSRTFWDKSAKAHIAARDAYIACPHCEHKHTDKDKLKQNRRGVLVAPGQTVSKDGKVEGEPPPGKRLSGWVSGLASPWVATEERVFNWITALQDGRPGKIQTVKNLEFGELFGMPSRKFKARELERLKGAYGRGQIMEGVYHLTAGVDVSADGLWWLVTGWMQGYTAVVIDYGFISGATGGQSSNPMAWRTLAGLINQPVGAGRQLKILLTCLDTRFNQDAAYDFALNFPQQVMATAGAGRKLAGNADWTENPIKRKVNEKEVELGINLLTFNTDVRKRNIQDRYTRDNEEPGGLILPADVSDQLLEHLVSEERIAKKTGGFEWKVHGPNHLFDCLVLSLVAILRLTGNTPVNPPGGSGQPGERAWVVYNGKKV